MRWSDNLRGAQTDSERVLANFRPQAATHLVRRHAAHGGIAMVQVRALWAFEINVYWTSFWREGGGASW